MEELSRPVWQDQPPARNPAVEEALASLIAVHGYSLFTQAGRLRRMLTEAAPDAPRHIAVVIVALSAEIPQRASRAKSDAALAGALQEWVQYLQQHASLDASWATWAVAVWAHAIGLPTIALGIVMDADTFSSPTVARAPLPGAATRATGDVVRTATTMQPVEPAFTNRRSEPSLGRPANDDYTASGNLIDPLFPEQRVRAPVGRVGPVVEPVSPPPFRAGPVRSPEGPTVDAMHGPAAVAPPPRRNAQVARQVIGGIVLVAVGVAIGFALRGTMRPDAPLASTSAPSDAAMRTPSPSPVVVADPKPQDVPPVEPRQAARPLDEPVVAPPDPLPAPAPDPAVATGSAPKRASNAVPEASTRSRSASASAASRSCRPTTCGTVVSAREIGERGSALAYDILVRMDNRDTRSFAARYRLQTGSRVRMSEGRFVPLDSRR